MRFSPNSLHYKEIQERVGRGKGKGVVCPEGKLVVHIVQVVEKHH